MQLDTQSLTKFRRHLHANAELSQHEYITQQHIREYLEQFKPDRLFPVADSGLLAIYEGENPGKTIMLRCDIDALPIQEVNTFTYRSTHEGISHKCGHDGHSAIMCGVASLLHQQRPESGKIALLFQPAEENGWGARAVLNDKHFQLIKPDMVFALHNLPGYPKKEIVVREGSFTAAAKSIIIKLNGKTAHAAEPEKGINPAAAMAEIIQLMEKFNQTDLKRDDFSLLTPIHFTMGEKAYGVSAGKAELHFTLRSWLNERMEKICEQAVKGIQEIAKRHKLELQIDWTEEFHANQNHPEAVKIIRQAAKGNHLEITERETPFKWGEDFGLFTEKYKGAMFGIGAGEDSPALHNPDYDFPDELIEAAAKIFHTIIQTALRD
jgi:amidohydrolase